MAGRILELTLSLAPDVSGPAFGTELGRYFWWAAGAEDVPEPPIHALLQWGLPQLLAKSFLLWLSSIWHRATVRPNAKKNARVVSGVVTCVRVYDPQRGLEPSFPTIN